MKKWFNDTTPFRSRCRKAIGLLIALGLLALLALFSPTRAQSVQSMVKNQPFPYAQGVAMDTVLYKQLKAKLESAQALRISSEQSIAALQAEITGLEAKLKALKALDDYDAGQVLQLSAQLSLRQTELGTAQTELTSAQRATADIVRELPRRIRKSLVSATPDQTARAIVEHIHTLQTRKWYWAGASALGGIVLTLTAHFF